LDGGTPFAPSKEKVVYLTQPRESLSTRGIVVAVVLAATTAGCSRPTGTVSGTVIFQGQPVRAGSITFVPTDGATMSSSIHEGSYSIAKIPTGACTILVVSVPATRGMWNPVKKEKVAGDAASGQPRKPMRIPKRYNDPKQSDLHYEVVAVNQTYNIELKP
jgi:hypothetical protein